MTHGFEQEYWERRWEPSSHGDHVAMAGNPPNPYLERELGGVAPGTALDAGCGAGAEAIWLAARGWRVTAVDIAASALAKAAERAREEKVERQVAWVRADLSAWEPDGPFDLVTTHYAHAAVPQLDLYDRLASWVRPGGTLLVVGHRHHAGPSKHHGHAHGRPPTEATVTAAAVTERLTGWEVVTAEEPTRTLTGPGGREVVLDDVVVRAVRR